MRNLALYRKTDLGQAEVGARKLKLNPRLRTMLILIDGAQDEPAMREEAEKVGAPPDFLEQLTQLGLVERVRENAIATAAANAPHMASEFDRFRAAKDFMNVTAVDALGIKAFFFTLKLERASTLTDLRGLAEAYGAALRKSVGEAQAAVFSRRLGQMLA